MVFLKVLHSSVTVSWLQAPPHLCVPHPQIWELDIKKWFCAFPKWRSGGANKGGPDVWMGEAGQRGARRLPACSVPGPSALIRLQPSPVPTGPLPAETVFCLLVFFLTSQTIPSTSSVLSRNFLCTQLLWGRAVCIAGSCVLDTGNLDQVAASWVWPAHWSAGLAGEPDHC